MPRRSYRTKRRMATRLSRWYRRKRANRGGRPPLYATRAGRLSRRNLYLAKNNSITVNLRMTGAVNMDSQFQTVGKVFKLNEFNSYSKFTAIFEQFRIVKIIQKIYPTADSFIAPLKVAITGADDDEHITQTYTPLLLYKIDRDDVETPTDLDDCLKNPSFKVKNLKRPQSIVFNPNVLNNIYQGAVTNNYEIKYGAWLNTENSSDNEYYGLVRCIHAQGCSSTYPLTFRIITTAVVQFKGLRLDE